MEDKMTLCTNCQRQIAASNYMTHSLHCLRNLTKCDKCGEAVPRSGLEEHHAEFHALIPCPDCTVCFEQPLLQKHRNTCRSRKVSCRFCELEMPATEMNDHVNYCGSRTKRCNECGEYVMLKYEQVHLDSNHGFLKLDDEPGPTATWIKNEFDSTHGSKGKSNNNAKKPQSNRVKFVNDSDEDVDEIDRMLAGLMKKGEQKKPPPSRHPGVAYPVNNAGFQRTFGRSTPSSSWPTPSDTAADDLVALPCEFCEAMIPSDQLLIHQTGCRPDIASLGPSFVQNKPTKNVNFLPKQPEVIDIESDSFIDVDGDSDSDPEVLMVDRFKSHDLNQPIKDDGKWSRKSNIDKQVDSDVNLPCEFCGDGYPPVMLLDHQNLCKLNHRTWQEPSPVRSVNKDVALPRPNNIAKISPQRNNEDHVEHIDLIKRVSDRLVTVVDDDEEDLNGFHSRHSAGGAAESIEHSPTTPLVFSGESSIAFMKQITPKEPVHSLKCASVSTRDLLSQPPKPILTEPTTDLHKDCQSHIPQSSLNTAPASQSKKNSSCPRSCLGPKQKQLPRSTKQLPHMKVQTLKKNDSSQIEPKQPKIESSITHSILHPSVIKVPRISQCVVNTAQDHVGYSPKLSAQPVSQHSARKRTPLSSCEKSFSSVPSRSPSHNQKSKSISPVLLLSQPVSNCSVTRATLTVPSNPVSCSATRQLSSQKQKSCDPQSTQYSAHVKKVEVLKKTEPTSQIVPMQQKKESLVTRNMLHPPSNKTPRVSQPEITDGHYHLGCSSKLSTHLVPNQFVRKPVPLLSSEKSFSGVPSHSCMLSDISPNNSSICDRSFTMDTLIVPPNSVQCNAISLFPSHTQNLPEPPSSDLLAETGIRVMSHHSLISVNSCTSIRHSKSFCTFFLGNVTNPVPKNSEESGTQTPYHYPTYSGTTKLCKSSQRDPPTRPWSCRSGRTQYSTAPAESNSNRYCDCPSVNQHLSSFPSRAWNASSKLPPSQSSKRGTRKLICVPPQSSADQRKVFHSLPHAWHALKAAGPHTEGFQGAAGGSSLLNTYHNNSEISKEWNDLDNLRPTAATGAIPKQKAGKLNTARQVTQEAQGSRSTNNAVTANRSRNAASPGGSHSSSRPRKTAERSPLYNLHNHDAT